MTINFSHLIFLFLVSLKTTADSSPTLNTTKNTSDVIKTSSSSTESSNLKKTSREADKAPASNLSKEKTDTLNKSNPTMADQQTDSQQLAAIAIGVPIGVGAIIGTSIAVNKKVEDNKSIVCLNKYLKLNHDHSNYLTLSYKNQGNSEKELGNLMDEHFSSAKNYLYDRENRNFYETQLKAIQKKLQDYAEKNPSKKEEIIRVIDNTNGILKQPITIKEKIAIRPPINFPQIQKKEIRE